MKNKFCIVCLILLFGLTFGAFAEFQKLTEPCLAFPKDFPESAKTNIMAVLRRPDCKFISGSALNSFTSLKYGGGTSALNLFLDELAKCSGVSLFIRFNSDNSADDCDWQVNHMAGQPGEFAVHISLKSSHIKLENLVIPETKCPGLPEKK